MQAADCKRIETPTITPLIPIRKRPSDISEGKSGIPLRKDVIAAAEIKADTS